MLATKESVFDTRRNGRRSGCLCRRTVFLTKRNDAIVLLCWSNVVYMVVPRRCWACIVFFASGATKNFCDPFIYLKYNHEIRHAVARVVRPGNFKTENSATGPQDAVSTATNWCATNPGVPLAQAMGRRNFYRKNPRGSGACDNRFPIL